MIVSLKFRMFVTGKATLRQIIFRTIQGYTTSDMKPDMFFAFTKILGPLLAPLNLIFLLFATGLMLRCVKKSAGNILVMAGIGVFLLCGFFPLGHNLLVVLERRYEIPSTPTGPVDGIIVLGGGMSTEIGQSRNVAALNDGGERVIQGLALAQRFPDAKLVFTGGNNGLRGGEAEAVSVRRLLADLAVKENNVLFEEQSRNTAENIAYTRRLVNPDENSRWIIITSAWHMPRAAAVIHSNNWPGEIIFWPADYRTDGKKRILPTRLDVLDNMDKASLALHEALGWLVYRLTRKIEPSIKPSGTLQQQDEKPEI